MLFKKKPDYSWNQILIKRLISIHYTLESLVESEMT